MTASVRHHPTPPSTPVDMHCGTTSHTVNKPHNATSHEMTLHLDTNLPDAGSSLLLAPATVSLLAAAAKKTGASHLPPSPLLRCAALTMSIASAKRETTKRRDDYHHLPLQACGSAPTPILPPHRVQCRTVPALHMPHTYVHHRKSHTACVYTRRAKPACI